MLTTDTLNALLLEAFSKQTTWLEASSRYPVEEFIAAFHSTRQMMQASIADLTNEQVAYVSPAHPMWSISESITHLIYSQHFYYNKLLAITTSQLPHMQEAARGFGEGALPHRPAEELRVQLSAATEQINLAIEATRGLADPHKIEQNTLFGACAYHTWILLLLGHEVDHVRQAIIMRRLAKKA